MTGLEVIAVTMMFVGGLGMLRYDNFSRLSTFELIFPILLFLCGGMILYIIS